MTFSYYFFWTFMPNFSPIFWLAHKLLWFPQRGTKNSKTNFFLQNISSIHYVEVIFFIWNHIFPLVLENKYIRIKNFVVFLSESMERTSDRFFIYFVKQFASIYLFCSFYNKESFIFIHNSCFLIITNFFFYAAALLRMIL